MTANAAGRPARLRFSHLGVSVMDIDLMEDFYSSVLGFTVTDRGASSGLKIVFMSRDPDEHHQVVLATGRPEGMPANTVNLAFGPSINQISFRVDGLSELRILDAALRDYGIRTVTPVNHGIAWSLYFPDPEGNNIECFVDTPWYIEQPFRQVLELSLDDETLMAKTHEMCRASKGYRPYSEWRAEIAARMAAQQAGRRLA